MSKLKRKLPAYNMKKAKVVAIPTNKGPMSSQIREAFERKEFVEKVAKRADDQLYSKYAKIATDNCFEILLTSMGLALKDCCPKITPDGIRKRVEKTMRYVEKFNSEWDGDIFAFKELLKERTATDYDEGFTFTVDSRDEYRETEVVNG